jgi:uncharacterized protein (DUF2141 family)
MIRKLISLSITIILYACATVQSPTGGLKDEKAPILYESNPKDQSINFSGTEINLFFNEWMKIEQLQNELIITPREDITFESNLKKQELTITLTEPLKESTTYTFNFRKALKDITEGNLWEDPVIAFSTGPFLDSLEVQGTITSLKNNSPQEGFLVGLYSYDIDTANLRQGKPIYFTTTDKTGFYSMQNVKAGTYKIYAFKDTNDNLINNSASEPFGFHFEPLQLYDSISQINMSTYSRNEDTLKLKKFSPAGKDFIVQYNKGLSSYSIINPNDSNQYIYANDIDNSKNLQIYSDNFPDLEYKTDSVFLMIQATDSIGTTTNDSIYVKLRESRITNDSIKVTGTPPNKIISGSQQLQLHFSKPVATINYDSLLLRIDTIPIYQFDTKDILISTNQKTITLNTQIDQQETENAIDSLAALRKQFQKDTISVTDSTKQELSDSTQLQIITEGRNRQSTEERTNTTTSSSGKGMKLQLYLGKAAFLGIEGDSSQATTVDFTFKKAKNYGIIKGQVIAADFPYVIELLNKDYKILDTLINTTKYAFNYVEPGDYRLRLLKDTNGNHQWDAGQPLQLKQAEQYIYLEELITVKANWEVIDKNFNFSVDNEVDSGEETEDL